MNAHARNFRQFSPLARLNNSVSQLGIFQKDKTKPLELGFRLKRFVACAESFHRNTIRLHRLLDSIARHFSISYHSRDRKSDYQYALVKSVLDLGNDVLLFFTILKILLDDIAFFVPFYFREPIRIGPKNEDLRDRERPLDFQALKHYIYKHEDIDETFVQLLRENEEWINDLCDKRKFLIHRFHDLSVSNDWWTHAHYALLYDFNSVRAFIPNILTYVSRIYWHFVEFTKDFEEHFTKACQEQFTEFEYSRAGQAYATGLDRTHLIFAGLGRMLENRILIRIHPARRSLVPSTLEYFMREEEIACDSCGAIRVHIRPTIEDYVVISSTCDCGKSLPIPMLVEERLFPHFMDQNQKHIIDQLIPYELRIKLLAACRKEAD